MNNYKRISTRWPWGCWVVEWSVLIIHTPRGKCYQRQQSCCFSCCLKTQYDNLDSGRQINKSCSFKDTVKWNLSEPRPWPTSLLKSAWLHTVFSNDFLSTLLFSCGIYALCFIKWLPLLGITYYFFCPNQKQEAVCPAPPKHGTEGVII